MTRISHRRHDLEGQRSRDQSEQSWPNAVPCRACFTNMLHARACACRRCRSVDDIVSTCCIIPANHRLMLTGGRRSASPTKPPAARCRRRSSAWTADTTATLPLWTSSWWTLTWTTASTSTSLCSLARQLNVQGLSRCFYARQHTHADAQILSVRPSVRHVKVLYRKSNVLSCFLQRIVPHYSYLRQRRRYIFVPVSVCLSVCLYVCEQDYSNRRAWIWMKCCVSTDVGTWTNWLTFEPDPDYSPNAGTGLLLLSPISYALQRGILLRRENPRYAYWRGRSLQRGVVLKWFLPCDAMHSAAIAGTRCPSVCPSRSWVAPKWIKISSKFFHSVVAKPFSFFLTKRHGAIPTGTPLTRASNARGYEKIDDFRPISPCISETRQFISIKFSFHPQLTNVTDGRTDGRTDTGWRQ